MSPETMRCRTPTVPLKDIPAPLPKVSFHDSIDHLEIAKSSIEVLNDLRADHFLSDAFWRDLCALTGTFRTFYQADCILAAWKDVCQTHNPSGFCLTPGGSKIVRAGPTLGWIQATFSFTVSGNFPARCSGTLGLVPSSEEEKAPWKIWILTTTLEEIYGFGNPDILQPTSQTNGLSLNGAASTNGLHPDPEHFPVVIVGAGMAGLSISGRLKALGVPSLIIETNSSIGGNWTNRYASVKLHTNKESSQMPLGHTFDSSYPYLLSGADLAKGYQRYAHDYALNVRTSTRVDKATWNPAKHTWTLHLTSSEPSISSSSAPQEAQIITSTHLILALGAGGQTPSIPSIPNRSAFTGTTMHSASYHSPSPWTNKNVLIIGTANTAHDVAEDMLSAHASSVTMVQRSPTPVLPFSYYQKRADPLYNENIPTEVSDREALTPPLPVTRALGLAGFWAMANRPADREYFAGLERQGFKVKMPCDIVSNLHERSGGHYLDVGASSKVIDGQMKSNAPPTHYTSNGLAFSDGTELPADLIVFATGFEGNMRRMAAAIVGDEVAEQLDDWWCVDAEGELRGAWKPIGRKLSN
ncbi:MAG: hypothetical protein Q9227_006178 [Pyrenula ochraceoflavens]